MITQRLIKFLTLNFPSMGDIPIEKISIDIINYIDIEFTLDEVEELEFHRNFQFDGLFNIVTKTYNRFRYKMFITNKSYHIEEIT